jgi:tetratricopeptide (TPR) repeat protein
MLCASIGEARTEQETQKQVKDQSFESILKSYLFINDFNPKEGTRQNSDELFWKYELRFPETRFEVELDFANVSIEMPQTIGSGREYEHINMGRSLFLAGKYDEARKIWLTGRQNFGKNYPFHRRNDYFIALSFLKLAEKKMKTEGLGYEDSKIKNLMVNAATFLSWAFILKRDNRDEILDQISPRGLYNLAAIYFNYKRYAAAYGAAESGLNYLRATGRKEYRSQLRRFVIEGYLQQQSYLSALQDIDTAIRQDPDPKMAAILFSRAGDIYFALNNYELAEEQYAIANQINREIGRFLPSQYVLRGESLFWLAKFKDAIDNFSFALDLSGDRANLGELDQEYAAVSRLRIADSFLALKENERAKLEYFRVIREFRGTPEAGIARMRSACLELPEYDGNNVLHARAELQKLKKEEDSLPNDAVELAWSCETASYTQRERTAGMIERVREFANKYPDSKFLDSMVQPIKDVRANKIHEYFDKQKPYAATAYFEKMRTKLYPKIDNDIATKLFESYVDTQRSAKAKEFYTAYVAHSPDSDAKQLRIAIFLAEVDQSAAFQVESKKLASTLTKRSWKLPESEQNLLAVERLRSRPNITLNLPWILNIASHWRESNSKMLCSLEYPILSQILKSKVASGSHRAALLSTIDRELPQLMEVDEACGVSMLSQEVEILKNESQKLSDRFLSRRPWPMTKPLTSLYWEVSEISARNNARKATEDLWRHIIDKAPKDAPEQSFAKIRIDQLGTEYDQLFKD